MDTWEFKIDRDIHPKFDGMDELVLFFFFLFFLSGGAVARSGWPVLKSRPLFPYGKISFCGEGEDGSVVMRPHDCRFIYGYHAYSECWKRRLCYLARAGKPLHQLIKLNSDSLFVGIYFASGGKILTQSEIYSPHWPAKS